MADQDPRATPAAPNHPASGPVTAGEIAQFLHRLTRRRPPALGGDPAEHAALLACKADLFARIADQHAHTDPAHAGQARQAAERARAAAARHAENPETQDSTDVNDLTSPSTPRWGISPSNTAEFRRASSPQARPISTRTRAVSYGASSPRHPDPATRSLGNADRASPSASSTAPAADAATARK